MLIVAIKYTETTMILAHIDLIISFIFPTQVSCIASRFFTVWVAKEDPWDPSMGSQRVGHDWVTNTIQLQMSFLYGYF